MLTETRWFIWLVVLLTAPLRCPAIVINYLFDEERADDKDGDVDVDLSAASLFALAGEVKYVYV